jgi:hypothetical protein
VAFPFDLVRIHLSFITVTLAFDHLDTRRISSCGVVPIRITGYQRSHGRTPRSAAR